MRGPAPKPPINCETRLNEDEDKDTWEPFLQDRPRFVSYIRVLYDTPNDLRSLFS
jgi:hypothetical protein